MLCKTPINSRGETCRSIGKSKTKYACIVDADETMRVRLEGVARRDHKDHISAKGINSLNHYNLVHKFIPMPQALKMRMQRRQWKNNVKNGENPGVAADKSQKQKEVIEEARNKGKKVHFASLMGPLCHLKNSEMEPQYQKVQRQSRTSR